MRPAPPSPPPFARTWYNLPLKQFALMSEGYAPTPLPGHPLTHWDPRKLYGGGQRRASAAGKRETDAAGDDQGSDVTTVWGSLLAFSVDIPQGLCPGGGGCSRVWMYGKVAWETLRERCRLAAWGQELELLEKECGVGDVASGSGGLWGLNARHACGAGPPASAAGRWQNAVVWNV